MIPVDRLPDPPETHDGREPGLRLFAARRRQVAATLNQVEVNGVEVKRIAPESLRRGGAGRGRIASIPCPQ